MSIRSGVLLLMTMLLGSGTTTAATSTTLPGLSDEAWAIRDQDGIPHVLADNEHDLILMQGWVHARDRLFQMDVRRRQASGTLAELLGEAALASDVELRTLGIRRAAEASMPVISQEARAGLEAYAEGVNAYVASHPLPSEYAALEITTFEPWTALDGLAVAKLIAFSLSFELDDIERTVTLRAYEQAGAKFKFDGTALFFEDIHRSAPFDLASTVPDAGQPGPSAAAAGLRAAPGGANSDHLRPETFEMGARYLEKLRRLAHVREALRLDDEDDRGSNEWAISGHLTASGGPLIANDPHLALDTPSTFYQIHLRARDAGFNVIGGSFAGTPYVIVGHNRDIAWGATVHPMDVTDVYREQVVSDPASPSKLSTVYLGKPEPVIPLPQVFRVNVIGDGNPDNVVTVPPGGDVPAAVLIVPRRNNGPMIELDLDLDRNGKAGVGLSVQFTGFSGTREIDTFRMWNRAEELEDFIEGLQFFDFGSENWAYADREGTIAHFTSGEMPVREDLQAGIVKGLPPFFIRDGTGGNEWLPVETRQPGQAIPFEILPFDEMPQTVNPPAGYFVNANNDPAGLTLDNDPLNQLRPGGGIYYLAGSYDVGIRAGRITQLLEEKLSTGRRLTATDMAEIQADVVQLDADYFVPIILRAFDHGLSVCRRGCGRGRSGASPALAALAADPRVAEAVGRLRAWDRSTPTGVLEGYDARDVDGVRTEPQADEVANSVAATIYNVWRGRILANTIDRVLDAVGVPRPEERRAVSALRHLFERFDTNLGIGASGLVFFNVPKVKEPYVRRDIIVLQSLTDALGLLAGPAFETAFRGSDSQSDYRWGRLHRIVLAHPLGEPFSIPPAGGAVPPSFDDLPGLAVDGGFEVVDASRPALLGDRGELRLRPSKSDDFVFNHGPTRRFVAAVDADEHIAAWSSLPGGESGVLGSPFYANLLGRWLTNDSHRLRLSRRDFAGFPLAVERFAPRPSD